jgi:hypothetical protein
MNAVLPRPPSAPAVPADSPMAVRFDKAFAQLVNAATTPPPPERPASTPEPTRRPAYQYD